MGVCFLLTPIKKKKANSKPICPPQRCFSFLRFFFFYLPHFSPAYLSPGGDGEDEINFSDHSLIKYRQRHRLSVRSQLFDQQMKSFQSCRHCHRNQTYLSWAGTSCGTQRTSQIRAFYYVIVAIQHPLAVFRISAAKPERGS